MDKIAKKKDNKNFGSENFENNSQLITILLEAEKKASVMIDAAKKRKLNMLKKARDDSTKEIDEFKKQLENDFKSKQKTYENNKGADAAQINREMQKRIQELNKLYKEHSASTLHRVVDIVVDVKPVVHQNYRK
jgi:V-type H+-transporting ATPase subunit G